MESVFIERKFHIAALNIFVRDLTDLFLFDRKGD